MSETPTLREELDRKVIDYLYNRETRRLSGNISNEVIGIEAGALWDVLCGLINDDAAKMLAQLETMAVRPNTKRYFLSPKSGALVLIYNPAAVGWVLIERPSNQVVAHDTKDAGALRDERLQRLATSLLTKGYKEIT